MKHSVLWLAIALAVTGCAKPSGGGSGAKVVIPPEEIVEPSPETPVPVPFDPDVAYPDAQPLPIGIVIPFDPDVAYPDAQPLPIGIVTPIVPPTVPDEPDDSDVCVEVTWELPDQRTDGSTFEHVEIANVIIVREPSGFPDVNIWQKIYDRGTLEERITASDPLIHFLDYNATSVDCDELGIRGNIQQWFGVVVVDVEGVYSDVSELVHPGQLEDE